MRRRTSLLLGLILSPGVLFGLEDEFLYLSGTGLGATSSWEFRCSAGRNCGQWADIAVPSQWELEGFGNYNYGHDSEPSSEVGVYRRRFVVPPEWFGRGIDLVFEGVMTDATVRLNGHSVGAVHQGGFTRFSYPVERLLRGNDGENLLEVEVAKISANRSVNLAERDADYWVFGGIYRPVYLRSRPLRAIRHILIAAHHEGRFEIEVELRGEPIDAAREKLELWIEDASGTRVLETIAIDVSGRRRLELDGTAEGIRPWSAEDPQLYWARLVLLVDGREHHRSELRFGFRTIELRAGEGLYVNDRRTLLKGVNRHAFWPPSGRTLNAELDRADVVAIKQMNLNAVRTSHYPPDVSFLDACDELGLFVIDELPGWHDAYDTEVGARLIGEMVRRDAHHPSIIFWANGNEGGWNRQLDGEFGHHDLGRRPVLHPDETFGGVDSEHYPTLSELRERLEGESEGLPLVLPTEMLHGLYDGGGGAGLEVFWRMIAASPRGLGGFIWSFADESVVRTDLRGRLDSDGNHAPDGILGPFREKSASFSTLREVFSPIMPRWLESSVELENRFSHRDMSSLHFEWEEFDLPAPGNRMVPGIRTPLAEQIRAEPGSTALVDYPDEFDHASGLALSAASEDGREIGRWLRPPDRRSLVQAWMGRGPGQVDDVLVSTASDGTGVVSLDAGATHVEFDLDTGEMKSLRGAGGSFPLATPRNADGTDHNAKASRILRHDRSVGIEVMYEGGMRRVRWELFASGWLHLSYQYSNDPDLPYSGVALSSPESAVHSFEWLGGGPHRVWGNRLEGPFLGWWNRKLGRGTRGYYRDVLWARLRHDDGNLLMVFDDPSLLLALSTPTFEEDAENAVALVPTIGLGLLERIPPIGSKFHPAAELGPPLGLPDGDVNRGSVWIRP